MYRLRKLPYKKNYISLDIYKHLSDANYQLGELKGILDNSRYLDIILRVLNVYEAKNSSEIGEVRTTLNDVFLQSISTLKKEDNTSEVIRHLRAINILYRDVVTKNRLYLDDISKVQELLSPEKAGIRKLRGHKIYNKITNEVLYIPPQNKNAIIDYFDNLLEYINTSDNKYDPLIKMCIIHYQFECIHPYKEANGRVGRILNSMSLILSRRLNYPILNLSKYLNDTKEEYFRLLEKCHNNINYLDEFIIYMLKGIKETTQFTIIFINQLTRIISSSTIALKEKAPKIYSKKLISHLFRFPYTKNELLRIDLRISRTTASKYLKLLESIGFIEGKKYGKEIVYKNKYLATILE